KARELGLDLDQFQKDLDGTEVRERTGADQRHANSVGVKTAPSVVINGYNVPNSEFGATGFRTAIKAALAKAAPLCGQHGLLLSRPWLAASALCAAGT